MIIGNGLLANAFKQNDNSKIIFFASGVSNSSENRKEEFERERILLYMTLKKNRDKKFIYFSTCSVYDESLSCSQYVLHKKEMENLVSEMSNNYNIFRLPQVVGKTKAPILINFLFHCIMNEQKMKILNSATRNLIYVDDVVKVVNEILIKQNHKNTILNIASPFNLKVINIVQLIESIVNKKAVYDLIEGGSSMSIDIIEIIELQAYNEIFTDSYIYDILKKYYEKDFELE